MLWVNIRLWKLRWHHFVVLYVLLAGSIAWQRSGMPEELARNKREVAAQRLAIADKVRARLPEFEAEVRSIRDRIDKVGFTTYDQYLKDRERSIIIRVSCRTATEGSYQVPPESEFYPVWALADRTCRIAVDQMYAERNKDMEARRTLAWNTQGQTREEFRDQQQEKWQSRDYNGLGLSMALPEIKYPYTISVKTDWSVYLCLLSLFYLAMIPYGLLSQGYKLVVARCNVLEQLVANPAMTVFFAVAWPLCGLYDPKKLAIRTRQAWLKRVESGVSSERFDEIERFIWSNLNCTLEEIAVKFDDVGVVLDRYRRSRLARAAVFLSVLTVMFRFNAGVAKAQEPPTVIEQQQGEQSKVDPVATTVSDALTLRYVEGESAIETGPVGPLNKPIRFSWKNTFARAGGRAEFISHGQDDESAELRSVQLRPCVRYGPWKVYSIIALDHDPRLLELNLTWCGKVLDTAVRIKVGREFVPYQSAVPPPFGGMLDGALTDTTFDFFGEGISLSIEPFKGLDLTAKVYKPVNETSVPSRWIFGGCYCFSESVTLGFQGQFGADPDEDWLVSGEVTGDIGDLYYEVLGAIRERPDNSLEYGVHAFVSYQLAEQWTIAGQADWLNSEQRTGPDRIVEHYRTTLAVWYEPINFIRLQLELAGDWLRRGQHRSAAEILGGLTVKF